MMLVFHTAGVPYKPSGKGSCLDPYFTKVGALWRALCSRFMRSLGRELRRCSTSPRTGWRVERTSLARTAGRRKCVGSAGLAALHFFLARWILSVGYIELDNRVSFARGLPQH